ncbi:MAG: hypothetical protein N2749_01700 [Clostridia bacterium]|nr:hypothetical protein [Clostridia bacterium]
MSGTVSYDLFSNRLGNGTIGLTPEGGVYETFINNTGTSVKGTIVISSTTVSNGVDIAPANSSMPIGIIYEDGIQNGSPVKVITSGKAQVLLKNGLNSSLGYWCGVSDTSGRMYQLSSTPIVLFTDNYKEIGKSLQSVSSGTDVLSLVQLNFS